MKRYILPLLIAFVGIAVAEPRAPLSPTVPRAAIVQGLKRLSTMNALYSISLEASNPRGYYAGKYQALAEAAAFLETQGFPEESMPAPQAVKCAAPVELECPDVGPIGPNMLDMLVDAIDER